MRSKAPSILLESADVVLDADPVVSPDLTICPRVLHTGQRPGYRHGGVVSNGGGEGDVSRT